MRRASVRRRIPFAALSVAVAGGSIGGGVISYELGGKQYVATTSGVVSGFFGGSGTSAVIVFALP